MRAVHACLLTLTVVFLSSAMTLTEATSMPSPFAKGASSTATASNRARPSRASTSKSVEAMLPNPMMPIRMTFLR